MNDSAPRTEESIDLENPRHVRALTGVMTTLDAAPGLYSVISGSGKEYTVDLDADPACTCPDFTYRSAAAEGDIEGFACKHIVRAQAETGRLTIPAYVNVDALDEHFGKFVKESPRVAGPIAVTDGGVVAESGDETADERPEECECSGRPDEGLPCWYCYSQHFSTPNPAAEWEGDAPDAEGR